jgi:hypothetical protein
VSRRFLRSIVPAIMAMSLIAAPASAAPSGAVNLTLIRDGNDLSEISWSVTGAIADSGTWTTENRIIGGRDGVSNAFVVTQVLTTQTGAAGTFHLRFQGLNNRQISFAGNWQLDRGTGAYAGMTGTGKWYASGDAAGDLVFNLSGYVR